MEMYTCLDAIMSLDSNVTFLGDNYRDSITILGKEECFGPGYEVAVISMTIYFNNKSGIIPIYIISFLDRFSNDIICILITVTTIKCNIIFVYPYIYSCWFVRFSRKLPRRISLMQYNLH